MPERDLLLPPDRSASIHPKFTYSRGDYKDPNSGPEHNPILELPSPKISQQDVVVSREVPGGSSSHSE